MSYQKNSRHPRCLEQKKVRNERAEKDTVWKSGENAQQQQL